MVCGIPRTAGDKLTVENEQKKSSGVLMWWCVLSKVGVVSSMLYGAHTTRSQSASTYRLT